MAKKKSKANSNAKAVVPSIHAAAAPNAVHLNNETVFLIRVTICVLFMITEIPPLPSSVPLRPAIGDDKRTRELSFAEEQDLAEAFIFISSHSIDPAKVCAICIEEEEKSQLVLKIAANHGDSQTLKSGLERVVSSLSSLSSTAGPASQLMPDRVLEAIVTLNYDRILCRLRSRHAIWKCNYKKDKAARPPIVNQLLTDLTKHANDEEVSKKLRDIGANLRCQFQTFEKTPARHHGQQNTVAIARLIHILKYIYELCKHSRTLGTQEENGSHRACTKLARYISTAKFLVRRSQTLPALRAMRIEVIRMAPAQIVETDNLRVEPALTRLQQLLHPTVSNVLQRRHIPPPTSSVLSDLIRNKCCVHAEIQLLFHYELHSTQCPPRVILSTKKPCFLCFLFFQSHGRFTVPRSHGRLYEKWALPEIILTLPTSEKQSMSQIIGRFLQNLVQVLQSAMLSGNNRRQTGSAESLFVLNPAWAQFSLENVPNRLSRDPSVVVSCTTPPKTTEISLFPRRCQLRSWSTHALMKTSSSMELACRKDTPLATILSSLASPATIRSPNIEIFLHHDYDHDQEKLAQNKNFRYTIAAQSLHHPDDRKLRKMLHLVDLSSLKPGQEITINQNAFHGQTSGFGLGHGSEVLFLSFRNQKI